MTEQTLEMAHEKKAVIVLACRRCGVIDKTVQVTSPAPPPIPAPPPPPCKKKVDERKRISGLFYQESNHNNAKNMPRA